MTQESTQTPQPVAPASVPAKKERKSWELLTVKYFQILLDYNLFRYGGKGELLK